MKTIWNIVTDLANSLFSFTIWGLLAHAFIAALVWACIYLGVEGAAIAVAAVYIALAIAYVAPSIPQTIKGIWRRFFPKKPTTPDTPPVDKTGEDEKLDIYKQFADSLAALNERRALNPAPIQQEVVKGVVPADKPEGLNADTKPEQESGNASNNTGTASESKPARKPAKRRTRSTKAGAKKPGNTNQKPQSSSKA